MKEKNMQKPTPVVVRTICSLCDEEWDAHGPSPTTLDCIRLLKAKRYTPTIYTPRPYPWYPAPWYSSSGTGTAPMGGSITVNYATPSDGDTGTAAA